ncbi:cysteine-rich CWC family protein [Paenibacillus sp. FSL H8-0537]|uniref:cysteine-rich CWC family protein n=1 Tax=Paenibacillus sp. FSL H8-0537 TaxID=2921399 RepID=UPI0031018103
MKKCPLCGGPNGCAIEAGLAPHSCWCFRERVPQSLLEQIPPEQRNQSCVCQNCVKQGETAGAIHWRGSAFQSEK